MKTYGSISITKVEDGQNGLSIVWKGESNIEPSNPQENWVYKNTENHIVYIYDGKEWKPMVLDGADGTDGTDGNDGLSVFITYHDDEEEPLVPTGDGTENGWHTEATSSVIWMSQKVAASATGGVWGAPIKIKPKDGQNGSDGNDGVGIDEQITQYYLSTASTKPSSANSDWETGWTAEFSDLWDVDTKYLWKRQKTLWSNGEITYVGLMLMDAYDIASVHAEKAGTSVGEWCITNGKTIIDGATIMTGTVGANQITSNWIEAKHLKSDYLSSLSANIGEIKSGSLQSTDYIDQDGIYSKQGTKIDLTNDYIKSKNFAIDANGDAYFKGKITVDKLSSINTNLGTVDAGNIQSTNYMKDTIGLKINLDDSTFDSPNFKIDEEGKIKSMAGNIGGWEIDGEQLLSTKTINDKEESVGIYAGTDWYRKSSLVYEGMTSPARFFCGNIVEVDDKGTPTIAAPFMVLADGSLYATAALFAGNIKFREDSDTSDNEMTIGDMIAIKNGFGDQQQVIDELQNIIKELQDEIGNLTDRVTTLENGGGGGGGEEPEPTTYTITFDANGGNCDTATLETGTDGKLASLPTATKDNKTCAGWFTEIDGGVEITTDTVFDKDTTVYAHWEAVYVTVTYDANGGSGEMDSGTAEAGSVFPLPSCDFTAPDGKQFKAWSINNTEHRSGTTYTFIEDTTVYAVWVDMPTEIYTITFNLNADGDDSASCDVQTMETNEYGKLSSLPEATRDGYNFIGWFTSVNGNGNDMVIENQTIFSYDTTIYAQWVEDENSGDEGSSLEPGAVSVGNWTEFNSNAETNNYDLSNGAGLQTNKGEGNSAPRKNNNGIIFYPDNTLTIEPPSGSVLSQVVLTYTTTIIPALEEAGVGIITYDQTNLTITWSGRSATKIVFTFKERTAITDIEVS